jgi:hypothetical protein
VNDAYFFAVVVVALVVVVPPALEVVLPALVVVLSAFLCALVVVVDFLPLLSLPPHEAAISGSSKNATTKRPYTNRGIPTRSCRISRPPCLVGAAGIVGKGPGPVADPAADSARGRAR